MARSVNRCPECGVAVTQFAAGCAVCGADLERYRRELAERRRSMPSVPVPAGLPERLRLPGRGDVHAGRLALAVFVTLLAPLFGLFLAAWFAYHAAQEGREGIRNALIAVCGFAFAMLYLAPYSIWALILGG
jgi:hypothetical protein